MERDIAAAANLVHLPRRPDYGSVGTTFNAVANNYNIEVGRIGTVFHFHGVFMRYIVTQMTRLTGL